MDKEMVRTYLKKRGENPPDVLEAVIQEAVRGVRKGGCP
jgi:hypothetical protein